MHAVRRSLVEAQAKAAMQSRYAAALQTVEVTVKELKDITSEGVKAAVKAFEKGVKPGAGGPFSDG